MRGTEIRQQLRNQSLENLLTSTINTVGDRIFPDDLAVIDMEALNQIVRSWRSTHSINYGQVLPNTGAEVTREDGQGIGANNNEVIEIVAVSLANAGGAPVEVQISIGDTILVKTAVAPTGTTSTELGSIFPFQEGEITHAEFMVTYYEIKEESLKLDRLRLELIYARNVVTYIRNEFNYDRGGIPDWFDSNYYLDIIEACKGYPLPEGTGITPLPTTE